MENLLRKYLEEKFEEQNRVKPLGKYPFITLSREFGCPSKLIAKSLAEALNKRNPPDRKKPSWRFINKEILMDSAKELDLDPSKLKYVFAAERKNAIDDIFASFSDQYKSDLKIKKTIREIIRSFALGGNVIIVGRGGVAITQEFNNGIHIRLQAPLEWRVQGICYRRALSEKEAHKLATDTDRKRTGLIEIFLGRKFDDSLFDLVFNCQTFEPDEIVSGIIHMMEIKELI